MKNRNLLEKYLPKDRRIRMMVLMGLDVGAVCLASFLGLFIRFDLNIEKIPPGYAKAVFVSACGDDYDRTNRTQKLFCAVFFRIVCL